jgi:two-component system, LuxR family, response regulator FixJ
MNIETSTEVLPCIHVLDDDAPFLRSLLFMVEGLGFAVHGYGSAQALLDAQVQATPQGCCILSDIRMPRMSGLELQRHLNAMHCNVPLIFMTGHGDIDQAVQAMRAGAVHFLQKPFKAHALLDALNHGIQLSQARWHIAQRAQSAQALLGKLTLREHDVAMWVARGLSNKEVGRALGISDNTVHVHRQRITDKLGSAHAADLARLLLRVDALCLDEA